MLTLAVARYALSPIDLIPDFSPVSGYLDDVIIVPTGILLVRRLIPPVLFAEHRAMADKAAVVIVGVWLPALALAIWLAWPLLALRLSHTVAG